jgi:hypothetical protein
VIKGRYDQKILIRDVSDKDIIVYTGDVVTKSKI